MIICIAGLTGSGKNCIGEIVAEKLGLRLVGPSFKTIAADEGVGLMDFQKKAEKSHKIDLDFDAKLVMEASRGNCVVTTWLGPWMIKNADLRVWLSAPPAVRAKRISGRDKMGRDEALSHISERDDGNRKRYKDVYGIDIYDHNGFDLVIETGEVKPDEIAEKIILAARRMQKGSKE